MNMSWRDFASIAARFPADAQTLVRLYGLTGRGGGREYTFDHLYKLVQPSSPESLASILVELNSRGVIERVFRVESPVTHVGLGDFRSLDAVPPEIRDETVEEDLVIEPRHIRPIFKVA